MALVRVLKLRLFFFGIVFLLGATNSQAEKSIAVLNLKSDQLKPTDCISVTNYITTELQKNPGYRIMAWDDVAKILEHKAGIQALGCDNDKCIVDIGGVLGVDFIVSADIGQLGSKYLCNLKIIDINKALTRNRVSEVIVGDMGKLTDLLPSMVRRLLSTLHIAAGNGDLAEVDKLLRIGTDVNEKDTSGDTPLAWAAWNNHPDVAQLLLNKGADVNTRNNTSMTPLHYAALTGHVGVAEILLKNGADVTVKDTSGYTPQHFAAAFGHPDFVTLLLSKGAEVNAKDHRGQTPVLLAARNGHADDRGTTIG